MGAGSRPAGHSSHPWCRGAASSCPGNVAPRRAPSLRPAQHTQRPPLHLRQLALGVGRQRVVRAAPLQIDVLLPQAAHVVELGGDVDDAGGAARLRRGRTAVKWVGAARDG